MINAEVTYKALRDGNTYTGDLTDVVRYLPQVAYNAGDYGWNCSVYACGSVFLVDGYRPAARWKLTGTEEERLKAAARNAERIPDTERVGDLLGLSRQAVAVIAEMAAIHRERLG